MNIRITKTKAAFLVGGAAVVLALSGAGMALASSDDDASDRPITGRALDRATAAALAETGGGTVTGTEVGDEESRYEVEVTLADGTQIDVQLDDQFVVVGTKADREDAGS